MNRRKGLTITKMAAAKRNDSSASSDDDTGSYGNHRGSIVLNCNDGEPTNGG
jgi:hypothetical protein